MQNRYPWWKNALLIAAIVVAVLYALPNLFPEDPAVQISAATRDSQLDETTQKTVESVLANQAIDVKSVSLEENSVFVRFYSTDEQLEAYDIIKEALGDAYTVALNLAPSTPSWLAAVGAHPMKLGLDLRGGVHFLLQVDVDSMITRRLEGMEKNIAQTLRNQRIRYTGISRIDDGKTIVVRFREVDLRNSAFAELRDTYSGFVFSRESRGNRYIITVNLAPAELNAIRQNTIEQTMSILRNRVNELGVGEAIVQQRGAERIAVDLPGIQDAARAKQILGGTATLEFRLVDFQNDAAAAQQSGVVPVNSRLYTYRNAPILLENDIILSGDSITSAVSSYDQQSASPAVSIQLGGGGESNFSRVTRANIGNPMAIVFVETKVDLKEKEGKYVQTSERSERVISVATIQSALGNNFQITGLQDAAEARDLALLLRAGALPTTIYPVEERTIGPSLGKENIQRGMVSLLVGLLVVLVLMAVYYRFFGLVADVALILNVIFLVAVLSLIGATLTLPGIAGIVLTVGMAVDANVLIYERIREELRNGATPQAAIHAGYERAFSTIVDANVTTLIVALILFAIGTGPVQGFAVTLSIGILTSMLTAIAYTRMVVNFYYGGRRVKRLSVGIKVESHGTI